MGYNKTNWDEQTPINVPNLQNIEDGIEGNSNKIEDIEDDIDDVETAVGRRTRLFNSDYYEQGQDPLDDDPIPDNQGFAGNRGFPKIYTENLRVDVEEMPPNGETGYMRNFTIFLENEDTVNISNVVGVFANSYTREILANIVGWDFSQGAISSINLRLINVTQESLSARKRTFNIMILGY